MPRTVLFLIRHAAPAHGVEADDPGLSATGALQAQALGRRLRQVPLASIQHGPARRTAQTAGVLGTVLPGVAVRPSELLRDRTPVPPASTAAALVPERYLSWFDDVPAAERDEGGAGLDAAVEHFSAVGEQDRCEALVTHSFVVGWFVRRAIGAPWGRWIDLQPDPASLTVITHRAGTLPRLTAFNDTGHLTGDLRPADR